MTDSKGFMVMQRFSLLLACVALSVFPASAWGKSTDSFSCQAITVPSSSGNRALFSRSGTADAVEVTVRFAAAQMDCTGAPLELNVMNRQLVHVTIMPPVGYQCVTTQSRATAPNANSLTDVLALIAKMSSFGIANAPSGSEKPPTPLSFFLDSGSNVVLTATVNCTDGTRLLAQSVKVTYQNPPFASVSAGILVSTSSIRSYGVSTAQTGVTNGSVATQNTVAITGSSRVQFVPFSYVNIYLAGTKIVNLNGQVGIGVNPTLSTPRVEFFASPIAVSWHDLYLSPGVHIGQHEDISNGFSVGEKTASSFSKLPIHWNYYAGIGFSLSYNLRPLVKTGSTTPSAAK